MSDMLTEHPFNLEKVKDIFIYGPEKGHVRTRDYRVVKILSLSARGGFPIVGVIQMNDNDIATQWTNDGKLDPRKNVTTDSDLLLLLPDEEGGAEV